MSDDAREPDELEDFESQQSEVSSRFRLIDSESLRNASEVAFYDR
jgi:hypothetical protein